jgi:hypothetical protein
MNRASGIFVVDALSQDQYHFKTMIDTEEIWFQDKGIYLPNGQQINKAALQSKFGRNLTIRKTNVDIAQIHIIFNTITTNANTIKLSDKGGGATFNGD